MKRTTYLYIYYLAISNFFSIVPFGYLTSIGRGFPFLMFQLFWLLFGYLKYKRNPSIPKLNTKSNESILLWLFIGIIPSVFMANELFGQTYLQSFISYRNLWLFLSIPTLLSIRPTIDELNKSIFSFGVTFLIVCLLRTLLPFQFYISSLQEVNYNTEGGSRLLNMPLYVCYEIILLPLYFYCVSLWKKYDSRIALKAILLFIILVLIQNRSTLFPALIVVAITILKCRIRPYFIKAVIILGTSFILIYSVSEIILSLLEETSTQLGSTYDPRVKAMNYFLDFNRLSLSEILFGTGNISFQTSSYVANLQARHIHYSDVGFIGFWSQFGLLPICVFVYYLLKCIFTRYMPWSERFVAIHILICSATISYFESPSHMIWFVLFYYQYCLYKSTIKKKYKLNYNNALIGHYNPCV